MDIPNYTRNCIALLVIFCIYSTISGKAIEQKPKIPLRPVTVKNVAFSPTGKFFAIPNSITTGSVGVFSVSPDGKIVTVPSRFSEKDFYRSRGVFYFARAKDSLTDLVFIPLQEYSAGYTVEFKKQGDTLAICGSDKILIYSSDKWSLLSTINLKSVSRVVFSSDNQKMAAIADGKIFVFKTSDYSDIYNIDPEAGCRFADVCFSGDGKTLAAFEYKNVVLDHASRIRIFQSDNGNEDRQLPWFSEKISSVPGNHFPLVSYLPHDTAIAVTLEKPIMGKVAVIKSSDGAVIKEFKGNCHAVSTKNSMFAAGGAVYDMSWNNIGSISKSALCMAFDQMSSQLIVVNSDSVQRFNVGQ